MFHWNIDPILFKIGPFQIHWYGLFFALSLLLAYFLAEWIFKREDKDIKLLEHLFIYIVIGLTIGARAFHVLFYDFDYYKAHPIEILEVWKGGLASHGGFLGVIVAILIFCKRYKVNFWWLISRVAMVAILVGAFIRVGNFFNSEIVGLPTNSNWGVVFDRVDNIPRHPVVLYESFSYFVIFFIMLYLYKRLSPDIFTKIGFGVVIILGFSARFILEYFKTAQSEFSNNLPLSMGQILSLPYIVAGIFLLIFSLKYLKSS